jgi:glycosyltransferase involved in cell wall biosynthesis
MPRTPESLRICLATALFRPAIGGEEGHAESLGRALCRGGHAVTVLTQRLPGALGRETMDGMRIERAIRSLHHSPLFGPSYAASVAWFLLKYGGAFDIVQTTYVYWDAVMAALLKPFLRFRLVVRVVIGGSGGDIDRFRSLRFWPFITNWDRSTADRLLELVFRRSDAFLSHTRQARDELLALGVPAARCHIVPNGIEIARYAATFRQPPPPGSRSVLCVGRLTRQKGQDVLLRALPMLRQAVGPVTVTLLGEGPERERLAALATELKVADAVRFVGIAKDVRPHLAAADAFVLPSRFEGLPFALLEAMAAGVPAVATAVDGSADVIRDGANGLLVPPEDPAALARALARVLVDSQFADRLSVAGRQTVAQQYSVDTVAERTLEIYRQALTGPPAGRRPGRP